MNNTYKSQGKKGSFDEQFAVSHLSEMGNPIESISKVVDFEMFRAILESRLLNTTKKNNAGAKPFECCDDVQNYDTSTLLQPW